MKINKEKIINKISCLLKKCQYIIKTIYDLPHSGKYLILSFFLFLFFLIITFSYDALIKKKIYGLEGKLYRSIVFSRFDFSITGDTYCDNLVIVLQDNNEITCKNLILNVALNPVTLLIKNRLKSDFQFDSLKYSTKDSDFLLNINGNTDVIIDEKSKRPLNGTIKIILSDSIIKFNNLNIPGPMGPIPIKIESINLQSGNIDLLIVNGNCKFNTFKLTGNDLSCSITGSVDFSNITNNPKLDLNINIDSESSILDQYRDILTSYIKNNILTIKLKGTFLKPELALDNTGKNEN